MLFYLLFSYMDKKIKNNLIKLLFTVLAPGLTIYSSSLNQPLNIRLSPLVLLLIPFILTIDEIVKEKNEIEDDKIRMEAKTLKPILIKLERVVIELSIFSQTTYSTSFFKNDVERLGWRKYFDAFTKILIDRFDDFNRNLDLFIENPKILKRTIDSYFNTFYWLVSDYHKFYNSFSELTELTNGFPYENKEDVNKLKTLEEHYDNYYTALKNLHDENEKIRSIFAGRYPIIEKPKKFKFKVFNE